jgi:hypothetical protein
VPTGRGGAAARALRPAGAGSPMGRIGFRPSGGRLEALIAPLVRETPIGRLAPTPAVAAAASGARLAVTERVWAAAGDGEPDAPPAGCADGERA